MDGHDVHPISQLNAIAGELEVDIFTVDFEILSFLLHKGQAGIENIRKNVRGSPGAVSYKISGLIDAGLVVRKTSEIDRRLSHYQLSPHAIALLDPDDKLAAAVNGAATKACLC